MRTTIFENRDGVNVGDAVPSVIVPVTSGTLSSSDREENALAATAPRSPNLSVGEAIAVEMAPVSSQILWTDLCRLG